MGKERIRDLLVTITLSFVLYLMGFSTFLFTFPLLMLQSRYQWKEVAFSSFSVLALVLITCVWDYWGAKVDSTTLCTIAVNLFIPVSLLAACVLWVKNRKVEVLRRLGIAVLPSAVFFVALAVLFTVKSEYALAVEAQFIEVYRAVFEEVFSTLGVDVEKLFRLLVTVFCHVAFALVFGVVLVIHFLSLSSLSVREEGFDDRIAHYRLPEAFIWPFLILWSLVLLMRFVSVNMLISVLLVNAALSVTMIYAIQGFAIVLYWFRAKNKLVKAIKLMTISVILFLLVPGINILVIFLYPLFGVLETWITMRK